MHDGTHIIDIIRSFIGNITELTGNFERTTRDTGYEDRATAWLKSENGIDIFLEAGEVGTIFSLRYLFQGPKEK